MTRLACNVDTCAYNEEHKCCLKEIRVDGSRADDERDTCCSSFNCRSGQCCNHAVEPNTELRVECEAINCRFNDAHACTARSIDIAGSGARRMEETECSTFASEA